MSQYWQIPHLFRVVCVALGAMGLFSIEKSRAEAPRSTWEASESGGIRLALSHPKLSADGQYLALVYNSAEVHGGLLTIDLRSGKKILFGGKTKANTQAVFWTVANKIVFQNGAVHQPLYSFSELYYSPYPRLTNDFTLDSGMIDLVGLPRSRSDRALAWIRSTRGGNLENRYHHLGLVEYALSFSSYMAFEYRPAIHTYPKVPGDGYLSAHPDREGELGWCVVWKGGRRVAFLWDATANAWRELALDLATHQALALDFDRRTLWTLRFSAENVVELIPYHIEKSEFGSVAFRLEGPVGEPRLHFSRVDKSLAGISYCAGGLIESSWLSARHASWHRMVTSSFPGQQCELIDQSDAESVLVFALNAPHLPGAYVILDTEKAEIRPIGKIVPQLEGLGLGSVVIKASSGANADSGHATHIFPEKEPDAALIVLLEPSAAQEPYSPLANLFLAEGYAVLRLSPAGARLPVGRSVAPFFLDVKQVSAEIISLTNRAVSTRPTKPRKVIMVGSGYWGALALSAAASAPGLFSAVSVSNAVYDWPRFLRELEKEGIVPPGAIAEFRDLTTKEPLAGFSFADTSVGSTLPITLVSSQGENPIIDEAIRFEKAARANGAKLIQAQCSTPLEHRLMLLKFIAEKGP